MSAPFRSLFALAGLALAAPLAAQNCVPTVTQTSTFNAGWTCSTFTYRYHVCLPTTCTEPVARVVIHFAGGVAQLDTSTVVAPANWGCVVDHVNDVLNFSTIFPGDFIYPGTCKDFEVTTVCHPQRVEGLQVFDFEGQNHVGIRRGVQAGFVAMAPYRSFLAGDPNAPIGQPYAISCSSPLDATGQMLILASPFGLPSPLPIPGLGMLSLDPILIAPLAPLPLGPLGTGQLQVPVPPDSQLSGVDLMFQGLTLGPQSPSLTTPLRITFR